MVSVGDNNICRLQYEENDVSAKTPRTVAETFKTSLGTEKEDTAYNSKMNEYGNTIPGSENEKSCIDQTNQYDVVLQQASKWIAELEQLRDTMTWYHVENSFHRDIFIMMDFEDKTDVTEEKQL
jgi:hypothetical protein